MKLKIYRTLWGLVDLTDGEKAKSPHRTLETALPALKALGYDGVEVPLKVVLLFGKEAFKSLLQKHGLKVIIMVFSDGPCAPGEPLIGGPFPDFSKASQPGDSDKKQIVATHLRVFQEQVEAAQEFRPTLVNSHSCKDYFTTDMAKEFFRQALAWQKEKGYRVMHETHRKRFLHSPWLTRDFAPAWKGQLEMVSDLSHWVNVAETDPDDLDLTKVIEDLAPQFGHTHCRVGYDHGPQVADPRTPEWIPYMEGHERWWDAIWKAAEARGEKEVTMTPEHGPPNYQQTVPGTGEPLADIWDVNHWIALRRQARFAEIFGKENTSALVASSSQGEEPTTNPGNSVLEGIVNIGFK